MIKRQTMPLQDKNIRNKNFDEVALGFELKQIKIEASRCLNCKNPLCVKACPVNINIPKFIKEIIKDDYEEAYSTIYKENIMPGVCGRVCPQEKQCEGACVLGIKQESVSIGALERFLGDYSLENNIFNKENIIENNLKVAIVGSGPAGLSAAASLRRLGYSCDIYEALHDFGGVLRYGIPEFRLPKSIVDEEINRLKNLNINFHKNTIIGKTLTVDQLFNEYNYKAIFVATGAGLPKSLHIKGENLNGVYYANEFLTRVNLMKAYQFPNSPTPIKVGDVVCVVGGGNVAMDAARVAKRLGAKEVFVLYRRDMEALPARREEINHAIEEKIDFRLCLNPVELIGEDYILKTVKAEIMKLGEKDSSGRKRPIPTGKYKTFKIDSCIIAIGQNPNPILKNTTNNLKVDQKDRIIVENCQTSIPGVFAGGDIVTGAATVIEAMGAGKRAAESINKYIKSTL
ncbi:MAG: NADPH-dependent glutamate synthase [Candidatus Izimaplasma sp.]|nr:NADPH-dependent glutamate synthase [Candidatus Izimaplasma bacterium]